MKLILVVPISLILLLTSAVSVSAATYYISPSGNDSAVGTESSPWKTFARAFSRSQEVISVKAGDTLLAKDGTYDEVVKQFPTGESWSKAVTVKAQSSRRAIIKPSSSTSGAVGIRQGDGNFDKRYITFEGFVLDCINTTGTCLHVAGKVDETGVDHVRIINNEIKNASGKAIFAPHGPYAAYGAYGSGILNSRANDVEYINNDIHHNGLTDYDHGIYQGGGNNILIEGNRIYNNRGSGIKLGWTSTTTNNIARNNLVYDNNTAWTFKPEYGTKRQGRGISTHFSSGSQIYNNVIWGAHTAGIDLIYSVTNAQVYNNTIYVNGNNYTANGISIGSGASAPSPDVFNSIVKNNIVQQATTNVPTIVNAPIIHGARSINAVIENNLTFGTNSKIDFKDSTARMANNIIADPQFVNLLGRDFHLRSSSPAINKGQTISLFTADRDYVRRPQGTAYDIGAYEYGGVPSATVPPLPTPTTKPTLTPVGTVRPTATSNPTQKIGDANGDNRVDQADYTIWLSEYKSKVGNRSDFNKDGKIDGVDMTLWLLNYGK